VVKYQGMSKNKNRLEAVALVNIDRKTSTLDCTSD
jgi:hypothetical protein